MLRIDSRFLETQFTYNTERMNRVIGGLSVQRIVDFKTEDPNTSKLISTREHFLKCFNFFIQILENIYSTVFFDEKSSSPVENHVIPNWETEYLENDLTRERLLKYFSFLLGIVAGG